MNEVNKATIKEYLIVREEVDRRVKQLSRNT